MLSGLRNAEKTPDKGWTTYPKFESTEDDSNEEEQEDNSEVLLLEDINGEKVSPGGNKHCLSNKVREPREYVCAKSFKIPKKSPNSDLHSIKASVNTNHDQAKAAQQLRETHNHIGKGNSSIFNGGSTMKTRLTRNSSLRNKRGLNIRKRIQRQNVLVLSELRQAGRNTKNSYLKTGFQRKYEGDNEPFEEEIDKVMTRNKIGNRTPNDDCTNDKDTVMSSDTESSKHEPSNSILTDQEPQSDASSVNPHDKELVEVESSTDRVDLYFKDLYQKSLLEITNLSEKNCSQEIAAPSKACNNCQKTSTQKHNSQQIKFISFPSAAATTRNSLHDYISTSDDEKGNKPIPNSCYGTARLSRLSKTYGKKKSQRISTKAIHEWTDEEDNKSNMSTNDEDSSAANIKKRKVPHKKAVKEDAQSEQSSSGKIRKKHKPEPDFYLISSTDEEDNQSGLGESDSGTEATAQKKDISEINSKTSETTAENSIRVSEQNHDKSKLALNPFERDSFTTKIMLGPCVMLGRLHGSTDGALEVTAHQIKWTMKYNNDDNQPKQEVVLILADDITSFKIHVDNDPKIIVLTVNQRCALKLRGKINGLAKYFNPGSPVVEETRIVLQVDDTLSNEIHADISEWVEDRLGKSYESLSSTEAEEFNQQFTSSTDPASNCDDTKRTSQYNTRSSVLRIGRTTNTPVKMIIYPRPPKHGGITVTSADVECLAQGQFLNDVIIDFYLKYIYHDKLGEEDQRRTHIFSSFFYKRLTQKRSSDNEFFVSHSERMHSQVKKWTRNVDIFSKDFIIVPINESAHWYLAIICFPNLEKPIIEEVSSAEECEENTMDDSVDSGQKSEVILEDDVNEEKDDAAVKDDVNEDADAEFEKSTLAVGAKKKTTSKQVTQNPELILKASPCILIFDSLGTGGRSRVFTNLRNYLSCEWKAKRPDEPSRDFSKESFKGTFPKVPEQDNNCDCGIFVLQYVESFFEDPIQNYRIPIRRINWFTHDGISGKRQEIKALILRLKEEYKTSS